MRYEVNKQPIGKLTANTRDCCHATLSCAVLTPACVARHVGMKYGRNSQI
jgi:hypothetical protein